MAKQNGKAKPKSEEPKAAYFLSLTLSNVRCFGPEQTLDLSDGDGKPARWTVLLGENGTGKTTILLTLLMLGWTRREPDSQNQNGVSWVIHQVDGSVILRSGELPVSGKIRIELSIGENLREVRIQTQEVDGIFEPESMKFRSTSIPLYPVCFAYGAGRRLGTLSTSDPDNFKPGVSFYSDLAEFRNPEEWLLRIDHAAARKLGKQQYQLDSLKQLLIDILPDIKDIHFEPGEGPYPKPHVDFKTPYGWVPLRQLGYGYQSMITWVVDLATRLFERYHGSDNPLAEPAVVLVDEIDLHLHPAWQRKLMATLTEKFPNTQFVVTAHSPLIAQAVENANIAVLRRNGDHVEIVNDVDHIRNWRVDQILTSDLFGLKTARPPYIELMLDERARLLSKGKMTAEDKKRVKQLEDRIGELPTGESEQDRKERAALWDAIRALQQETPAKP